MGIRIEPPIRALYTISLALYAASFLMPAVINPHPTPGFGLVETWGWQAALLSLTPLALPVAGPSNIGYLLAAAAAAARWFRVALALCAVSLASMIYCGIALPERPGDTIRYPGGHLGPGYYAWLLAGIIMMAVAFRGRRAGRA